MKKNILDKLAEMTKELREVKSYVKSIRRYRQNRSSIR